MFSTGRKGDIGVHKSIAVLLELGLDVFLPVSSSKPYDILVGDKKNFYKMQVKYRKIRKDGTLAIEFAIKCSHTKRGTIRRHMTPEDVDIFCIYCPDTDKCYFVESDNRKSIMLRIIDSINNQKCNINHAKDFEKWPYS